MALAGQDVEERVALGARLRAHRVERGLSLREVAAAVGVSAGTWSAVENGRAPADEPRLEAVARVLSLDPVDLRGDVAERADEAGAWRTFEPLELPAPLRGALHAFLELGYHGATVRDIAQRAGLSVPGVYHHWPSKQHLLVELMDSTMGDLLRRAGQARSEAAGPAARLGGLVECLALFHTYRRELAFIGASEMRSLEEPDRTRIVGLRTAMQRMVDDEVEEGVRGRVFGTRRPHEAARAVVTMCVALPQWWSPTGPSTPEQTAAQYVDFALDLVGLRTCTPEGAST
ncbi:MAG: TetR family transcriptional regulator [Sporichthyaceae bacterium]